jgi:hypothetical protein
MAWMGRVVVVCVVAACRPDGGADTTEAASEASTTEATTMGVPTTSEPMSGTTAEPTSGTTAEPTTGEPFAGVTLVREEVFVPVGGEPTTVLADPLRELVAQTIEAGGAVFNNGEYDGAGRRRFAGVPEGTYVIRGEAGPNEALGTAGVLEFRVTDVREVDVGGTFAGRAGVEPIAADGTTLRVDVTGMQALGPGDAFEAYSGEADAIGFFGSAYDPAAPDSGEPAPGATELAGWTLAWDSSAVFSGSGVVPRIEPDRGDVLRLSHLIEAPLTVEDPAVEGAWAYASTRRLGETAVLELAAMTAGAENPASGAFAAVPTVEAELDLRLAGFLDEVRGQAGASVSMGCNATILLEPGVEAPIVGMVPTLGTLDVFRVEVPSEPACYPDDQGACDPVACPDGCNVALGYGNPYAGGTEVLYVRCFNTVLVTHPVAGTNETSTASVATARRLDDGGPVVATLGVPRALRINGEAAPGDAVVTGVGTTPTLSFEAPAFGTADYYIVRVRTLEDVVDADEVILSRRRLVATIATAATSVQVPAGVLEVGAYYAFDVLAVLGSPIDAPNRTRTHAYARSSATSGLCTP